MTHTQAVMFVAMTLLIAFLYGVILWTREGQMDRLATDLESLERTVGLMLGRENNRGEYVPEDAWAPRAMEQPTLEPITEPIPLPEPFPATEPTQAVIADGWRDLDAMYAEAMANIEAMSQRSEGSAP